YPAAGIPRLARQHGAELCIINAEPTPYDDVAAVVIHGKAGEVLPEVVRRVAQESYGKGYSGSGTGNVWPQAGQTTTSCSFGALNSSSQSGQANSRAGLSSARRSSAIVWATAPRSTAGLPHSVQR